MSPLFVPGVPGEGSTSNDVDEITAIAFAFANRARAWGGKTVDEVIAADPNYTYAINGTNERYESFMKTTSVAEVNKDFGTAIALQAALKAWANEVRVYKLPSLFAACSEVRLDGEGRPLFFDAGYIYAERSHNAIGTALREYVISGGEFVPTGISVTTRFVEPENVWKFEVSAEQ